MLVITAVREDENHYRLHINTENHTQKHKFKAENGFFVGFIFIDLEPHQVEMRDDKMFVDSMVKETPSKVFIFKEFDKWVEFEI